MLVLSYAQVERLRVQLADINEYAAQQYHEFIEKAKMDNEFHKILEQFRKEAAERDAQYQRRADEREAEYQRKEEERAAETRKRDEESQRKEEERAAETRKRDEESQRKQEERAAEIRKRDEEYQKKEEERAAEIRKRDEEYQKKEEERAAEIRKRDEEYQKKDEERAAEIRKRDEEYRKKDDERAAVFFSENKRIQDRLDNHEFSFHWGDFINTTFAKCSHVGIIEMRRLLRVERENLGEQYEQGVEHIRFAKQCKDLVYNAGESQPAVSPTRKNRHQGDAYGAREYQKQNNSLGI